MSRHVESTAEDDDINMTPMLDIVFIMLIFFIVTASFVKESGTDVRRQEASMSAPAQGTIFMAVTEAGEVWLDRKSIELGAVSATIEKLLAENPTEEIVIQVDRESTNGLLVKVMAAVKQGGAEKIMVATQAI
jgi:biopolymer transport protein ExbD